jgi:hypothetical protein
MKDLLHRISKLHPKKKHLIIFQQWVVKILDENVAHYALVIKREFGKDIAHTEGAGIWQMPHSPQSEGSLHHKQHQS